MYLVLLETVADCRAFAGPQPSVSQLREFRGTEFYEDGHARRRLAGELEVVLAHPVIAPLFVELGHHREVVDDMLRQARCPKLFAPLGSRCIAIVDRPAERSEKDDCRCALGWNSPEAWNGTPTPDYGCRAGLRVRVAAGK